MESNFSVVLIEDDEVQQKIMGIICKKVGITLFCECGDDIMGFIRQKKPDVIFSDLLVGYEFSAFQLLQDLRSESDIGNTPFVIITSSPLPEDRTRAMECGASDFFVKPLNPVQLEQLLLKIKIHS